jgi:4-hydroxy 2-oxovalerate aldolase
MNVKLMDCSVRDGVYLRNMEISKSELEIVCSLVKDYVDFVEVGHGLGLGGFRVFGNSKRLDHDSIEVASIKFESSNVKWGFFAIAGIAKNNDLSLLRDSNCHFIRVGMDYEKLDEATKFSKAIIKADLKPIWFFMKSYAWTKQQISRAINVGRSIGVDLFYIVDSAGCMTPDEVAAAVFHARSFDINVGFHGHDNLGMAIANCISAVNAGCHVVDGAILGVGRSGGNCLLEGLLRLFRKDAGSIGKLERLNLKSKCLEEIYPTSKYGSNEVLYGLTGFHSGFEAELKLAAKNEKVDFYRLVSVHSKITLMKPTASSIKKAVEVIKGVAVSENEPL